MTEGKLKQCKIVIYLVIFHGRFEVQTKMFSLILTKKKTMNGGLGGVV